MMSQTSANLDANVNPMKANIVKVRHEEDSVEMVDWKKWSLKDIIRVLKDMVNAKLTYGRLESK